MNDTCLFCDHVFEQGDMAVVIGHITHDGAGLMFVHRNCLLREVVGDATANYILREQA